MPPIELGDGWYATFEEISYKINAEGLMFVVRFFQRPYVAPQTYITAGYDRRLKPNELPQAVQDIRNNIVKYFHQEVKGKKGGRR